MSFLDSRRRFLRALGASGAALATGSWLSRIGYTAAAGPARAVINQAHSLDLPSHSVSAITLMTSR
jgi:hypothetical protein